MKPYPAYKASGVEWLGEVPEGWEVSRLKNSVNSCRNGIWGADPESTDDPIICVRVADFDRNSLRIRLDGPTFRAISTSEREGRLLKAGNLILEKSGGGEGQPVGAVMIYEDTDAAVCSNFVARLELADGMEPRYWLYAHRALYDMRVNVRSIKQTSGIQNLDQAAYFEEKFVFPPLPEQRAIAGFLDREVGKIDALVAESRRLVALLAEKRQATISHAVTRGLNPAAPLRPSGIDWLGDIPEGWEVKRLSYVCDFEQGKPHEPYFDDEGLFICVTARFVSTAGEKAKFCSENLTPAHVDDILMVMSDLPNGRALARAFHVDQNERYAVNQRVCRISVGEGNSRYFFYQLNRHKELLRENDGFNQTHLSNSSFTKLGHVDKWRSHSLMQARSTKPRKLSAVLS